MPELSWKNYILTGLATTATVAAAHTLATYTNCPVANEWYTAGTAGAVACIAASHESQHKTFSNKLQKLFKRN